MRPRVCGSEKTLLHGNRCRRFRFNRLLMLLEPQALRVKIEQLLSYLPLLGLAGHSFFVGAVAERAAAFAFHRVDDLCGGGR